MNLSIIIPVYNEKDNLKPLYAALLKTLNPIKDPWEIIFVDDGSQDDSLQTLRGLAESDTEHTRVISFRRNFGQTAAIAAGIDFSKGDTIVLMDADLQNDPEDIPKLLSKLDEGYDLVSGWRKDRRDNAITRNLPSAIANWVISTTTGVHLHDYGCTLKAYKRDALEGFRLYGEMHRFIPVFAHSIGSRITEIPVSHHERKFGKTNYGLERTLKVILDLFTVIFLLNYTSKPIRLFGGTGLLLMITSALIMGWLLIRRIFFLVSVLGSPFFQLGVMFFILGFQSVLMGMIAELLVRTYYESQQKPAYTIREKLGFDQKPDLNK